MKDINTLEELRDYINANSSKYSAKKIRQACENNSWRMVSNLKRKQLFFCICEDDNRGVWFLCDELDKGHAVIREHTMPRLARAIEGAGAGDLIYYIDSSWNEGDGEGKSFNEYAKEQMIFHLVQNRDSAYYEKDLPEEIGNLDFTDEEIAEAIKYYFRK